MNKINLEETQWWSKSKLEKLQNALLWNIIDHAYKKVPYYQRVFKERGLTPQDIKTKDDLKKLPILTKKIIKRYSKDLIYKPLCTPKPSETGGSTGEPFIFHRDYKWNNIRTEIAYRQWRWAGYRRGDRLAILFSRRLSSAKDGVMNLGGPFEKDKWREYIKQLHSFKPSFIYGYTTQLYMVAIHLLKEKAHFPVKSVIATSETLYKFQRETIEKAFRCPVFDEYGCADGGLSAFECDQHSGLHHAMECSIIEIVNGKVIATDLWNKAQPFIRYENGDRARKLNFRCPCGRELDLYQIKGRDNDIIVTPRKEISPTTLMHLTIRGRKSFEAVQYIQQPGYKLIVNIVKNAAFSKKEFEVFFSRLSSLCDNMKICINFVKKITVTRAGKTRFIINKDKELLKKYYGK